MDPIAPNRSTDSSPGVFILLGEGLPGRRMYGTNIIEKFDSWVIIMPYDPTVEPFVPPRVFGTNAVIKAPLSNGVQKIPPLRLA